MTQRRMLLVAGFVLLTVTGCQSGTATSGANAVSARPATSGSVGTGAPSMTTNPTTAPARGTGRPVPPGQEPTGAPIPAPGGGTSPVPPAQVETAGLPTNPPQAVQTANGGRTVVFTVEQSGCQQLTADVTGETPTSVAITVVTTVTSRGGQMCPMIVRVVRVAANLAMPLGTRKIVFTGVTKHS